MITLQFIHRVKIHFLQIWNHQKSVCGKSWFVKVKIHDFWNRFQESSLASARENGFVSFTEYLLDLRFLPERLPAHDASDVIGSETSFDSLLQKHGWNVKSASTLRWQLPTMELEERNIFLGVSWFYVVYNLIFERLPGLGPIEPLKGTIFKLQVRCKTWLVGL